MPRPITLFTGQWADLRFEQICEEAGQMGYDGLEIACWGDHMDVAQAATSDQYIEGRKKILEENGLQVWALGAHLAGQCVGDLYDPRLDNFAPKELAGRPEEIRVWAIDQMKRTAVAASRMGCSVVTGFMGSAIWKYFYSFPQTTKEMIDDAFAQIVKLWTPILDEFDRNSVRFALEVHPTEIAFDYYTTQRLLEEFDHRPTLGLNFDPSHLLWQGITPHVFLRDFSERIYHVHMKDVAVTLDGKAGLLGSLLPFGDVRRGWNFRSLGHGDVEFEEIIRELNAMGYDGPLSVEWEDTGMDREYGAKEALEYCRSIDFPMSQVAFDDAMKE
ncbi:MAG TPA: sugar phosphate isomerase/epimerase [Candidatus Acetothermia bacterium]|nr:sugar phosphate isomerase/epimerase [Candidatus Acetothermia bacterium]